MTDLETIELHDGLIVSAHVQFNSKSINIGIRFYSDHGSKVRTEAEIVFNNVASISGILDLMRLELNAGPGNINYWVPAKAFGQTYIYLSDGCIVVTSDPPVLVNIS